MLKVTVTRKVTTPEYRILQSEVALNGRDKLTPQAARAALEVAFGNASSGEVWDHVAGYGYRVYGKSARKVTQQDYE